MEKAESIGNDNYSIIIHGKHNHEKQKLLFLTPIKTHHL